MSQITIIAQSGGGGGGVNSVTAGTNIVITGTASDPIVNLSSNPDVPGTVTAQNFKLPATTTSNAMGTIFIDNKRFLYAYPDSTSTFLGSQVANALNSGTGNTAIGGQSMLNLDTAQRCTAVGYQAGFFIESATDCTLIGKSANVASNAHGCVVIGSNAGTGNLSPATSNIYIDNVGSTGETLTTRIGTDQTQCFITGITGVSDISGTLQTVVGINTSNQLTQISLLAGSNITLTPGIGTLSIDAIISGFTWNTVTTNTNMLPNNGYITNGSLPLTLTLPSTSAVGDIIEIVFKSSAGWSIAQGAGQTIYHGSVNTTTGVTGSFFNVDSGSCVSMICITADTDWRVKNSQGNFSLI